MDSGNNLAELFFGNSIIKSIVLKSNTASEKTRHLEGESKELI